MGCASRDRTGVGEARPFLQTHAPTQAERTAALRALEVDTGTWKPRMQLKPRMPLAAAVIVEGIHLFSSLLLLSAPPHQVEACPVLVAVMPCSCRRGSRLSPCSAQRRQSAPPQRSQVRGPRWRARREALRRELPAAAVCNQQPGIGPRGAAAAVQMRTPPAAPEVARGAARASSSRERVRAVGEQSQRTT
eukprot:scaffold70237_cov57-Phaeocystis_antarctica.AAC.3